MKWYDNQVAANERQRYLEKINKKKLLTFSSGSDKIKELLKQKD